MLIDAQQIRKSYGEMPVLTETNMTIPDGQFVSIVGPTGCGKSTFMNLVAGFEVPSSGVLHVGGQPVYGPGPDRGVVFQDPGLYPWLTALQNVELGLKIQGVPPKERQQRAREFLNQVGLAGFEHHYPHKLSGGMRQRVALARTLICEPRVLLMDEPFGALDAITRAGMQELLLSIWSRVKATVIFVTHDVDEAVLLSDRVLAMSRRPGTFVLDVAIDLPRPRHYEITTSEAFLGFKRQLLGVLKELIEEVH